MKTTVSVIAIGLAWVAAAGGVQAASGRDFPTRPIRFVVGPAPDVLARMVGQKLAEAWGEQVVVDQRPAAGGIVAAEIVAKAAPDGYTWLMSTGAYTTLVGLYPKLPYDFVRDLAPVTLMATIPFLLMVHPAVPAKSVQELVALARAQPGRLNYASGGNGTTSHLAGEMFNNMAKVKIVHVPYKSVPASLIAVLGGEAEITFAIMQAGFPYVTAGRLRALAVTGAKRSPSAPELPTVAESGVPGYEFVSWNGVHVPAATPKERIRLIQAAIVRALAAPDVRERMFKLGLEVVGSTPEQLAELVRSDIATWGRVIREAGVRAD
jgi:tripartite-type tricarboxylate transporter receptor subunit TctC